MVAIRMLNYNYYHNYHDYHNYYHGDYNDQLMSWASMVLTLQHGAPNFNAHSVNYSVTHYGYGSNIFRNFVNKIFNP